MSLDRLESTNQIIHDLERKLSISSSLTNQSHTSHGSVVQDPAFLGVGRQNIQLSVLSYIKNNGSDFDAGRVYANRQQKFSATSFGREYSPSSASPGPVALDPRDLKDDLEESREKKPDKGGFLDSLSLDDEVAPLSPSPRASPKVLPMAHARENITEKTEEQETKEEDYNLDHYDHYYDSDEYNGESFTQDLSNSDLEASPNEVPSDDDLGLEQELLLPPLPPRMPPRELEPDKLYGMYDFLGPDPLHCTLSRDEPVYLRNDSDNYWWLIQKLSKRERLLLWNARGSEEDLFEDDEHGKIGFVPAECLETYEERLARLNCFRNENLDKEIDLPKDFDGLPTSKDTSLEQSASPSDVTPMPFGRTGSILKKSRGFKLKNKLVTFENLEDLNIEDDFDSDDGEVDFSDHYYSMSHEDISDSNAKPESEEKMSEVLSDVFPCEIPLQISKKSRKKIQDKEFDKELNEEFLLGFDRPHMHLKDDHSSIGSFSPDTPQQENVKQFSDDGGQVRRSIIIDRLHLVTADLAENSLTEQFGGVLQADSALDEDPEGMISDSQSLKTQLMEEVSTPRASILNAEIKIGDSDEISHLSPREKKRMKPVHDMFTPLLGKLDELSEKLAELEHSL